MAYIHSIWALVGVVALAGAVAPARADTAAETTTPVAQELAGSDTPSECDGASVDEARRLAQDAQRNGAHRRAAKCFRLAGDLVRADRALIRASADTSAVTTQKAAVTLETAKLQARRLRAAFRKS